MKEAAIGPLATQTKHFLWKAQKAKMKRNEATKGQDERKWSHKRPKWKEMKPQKAK